jgi:hypothetical protein
MTLRTAASTLLALTALALAGCGDQYDVAGGRETMGHARVMRAPPVPMADAVGEESAPPDAGIPEAPQRRLIRDGHVTLEVPQVEPAVERLQALAEEMGGHVAHVSMRTGAEQFRQATVTLRIPAARFDDAIAGVRPLGKVEQVDISVQDVTEQYTDLEARLANARRLEERLLEILATRAGTLDQVLSAERELARVRTEIERYDGRLRQLAGRVELSTLTVVVREPRPLLGTRPGESLMANAFRQSWRNFVWTVAGIISVAGAALPILVLLGLLVLAAVPTTRWLRRRRRA